MTTEFPKPRIRLYFGVWFCHGATGSWTVGAGNTPKKAFDAWLTSWLRSGFHQQSTQRHARVPLEREWVPRIDVSPLGG